MKEKRIYKDKKFWKKQINSWEQSGLSQSKFCRLQKLRTTTFSGWKHRLSKKVDSLELVPISFPLPKVTGEKNKNTGLFLTFGNFKLEIGREFDRATFIDILRCLESI